MRLARVIGKVVLNKKVAELPPGSYLLARTLNRGTLAGGNEGNEETLVMYDVLSAGEKDIVGMVEGREAACPFHPRRVPLDAYNGCILDQIDYEPVLK